jgi:6-phosphogluconolactonase
MRQPCCRIPEFSLSQEQSGRKLSSRFRNRLFHVPAIAVIASTRPADGATLCGAMNNLRCIFSVAMILLAPVVLFAGKNPRARARKTYRAYVGNYTSKTDSKGIYQFNFDPATGKMSGYELAGETKDPSWVIVHPNGKFLYAANEMDKGSTISAFSIAPQNGKLTLLNQQPAQGEGPCHLSFDRTGKFLLTANYSSGNVAVFPILADGKLGEPTAQQEDKGKAGPNTKRQDRSHAHWIGASEDNKLVYVADLGLDQVLIYKFDVAKGTLADSGAVPAKPGTGPRHIAFSRNGKFLYLLGELDSTVTVFAQDQSSFHSIQNVPMLPTGFSGRNDAAEIEIHPNGGFLYASNRGHDSFAVYAIDQKKGTLTQVEIVPTGGKEPRHFAIDPTGHFLLAENQNTNQIVEFRIDQTTGKLTPTGETLATPSPICISFLPVD